MPREYLRKITLPPADRAHWRAPAGQAGLLGYLAWGEREYGITPIPVSRHEEWVYAVVELGGPILVTENRRECLTAPTLAIIGPDRAFGWEDDSKTLSRLLVWAWRVPPQAGMADLSRDAMAIFRLRESELRRLRWIHSMCRGEVQHLDGNTDEMLAAFKTLIDVHLCRIIAGHSLPTRDEIVAQALEWMKANLATRQPLARLSDFLGISPATVQRLFHERLGTSVTNTIAELRRLEADRMLAIPGTSIKEVAFRLGYLHPHDFSRAYLKHAGRPARRHR